MSVDWSKAPEGAEMYAPGMTFPWRKWKDGEEMFFNHIGANDWLLCEGGWSKNVWLDIEPDCILRPKPADEWVDGLPRMAIMVNPHEAPLQYGDDHLGKEIEAIEHLPGESCYVVRFDWGLGVLHDSMVDFGLYKLRTHAERERERVIDNALSACGYDPTEFAADERPTTGEHDVFDALQKLYDANLLRKPAEEVGREELQKLLCRDGFVDDIDGGLLANAILSTYNVTKKGE